MSQPGDAGVQKAARGCSGRPSATTSPWDKGSALELAEEQSWETKRAPLQSPPRHSFRFGGGDFLLPPSHLYEEGLNFLKLEHEVVSPDFFRSLLPFMLPQLLEVSEWNEELCRTPCRNGQSLLPVTLEAGCGHAQAPPVWPNSH